MARPTQADIRELILTVAKDQEPRATGNPSLQQGSVLDEVGKRLGIRYGDPELEEAVLTEWHDLMRTGYFAWGLNLSNPKAPFFHFTERGRRVLEKLSRDPGNPSGYLRHLATVSKLSPIAMSYLREGLDCFVAGLNKAAAVMIGAAAESIVLEMRDIALQKLSNTARPKGLSDWRIKSVLDALYDLLDSRKSTFPKELREEFEAYWLAFAQQIRATRNDAGHPTSVDPVTEEGVHASYLIFPDLARLSSSLTDWMTAYLN